MNSARIIPYGLGLLAWWQLASCVAADDAPDRKAVRSIKVITNSIGMKLALIPGGEFFMGAADSDKDANTDESPQHRVEISKSFLMGIHEVTVGQFATFVEATEHRTAAETEESSGFNDETHTFQYNQRGYHWRNVGWKQTNDHPVLNVTWGDARASAHLWVACVT